MKHQYRLSETFFLMLSLVTVIAIASSFIGKKRSVISRWSPNNKANDSIASVAAFKEVYKVLMSPRCMNCHPAGDTPLQGDDSHLHTMGPKRGKDGKGLYAMKCGNCHQPVNAPGIHTPPGNPKWQLPPSDMKMVFQGKSARELALQIKDDGQNGHKNNQQLLEHARDTLVKSGWNMGEGRVAPPLDYKSFLQAWDTWIEKGAYAPAR
jgi:hypothetical protein